MRGGYRWAEGHTERLRDLANELVRLKVDVIVSHNTPGPLAAKEATSTIPIVFATAGDPVGSGIVASLARPGGNVTGLSSQTPDVAGKRLESRIDVFTAPHFERGDLNAEPGSRLLKLAHVQLHKGILGIG